MISYKGLEAKLNFLLKRDTKDSTRDWFAVGDYKKRPGVVGGRLIALKECLRFGIVPFLIEDSKKAFCYRGLSEWDNEKGWLTDTCLDGQDTFRRLLAMFEL